MSDSPRTTSSPVLEQAILQIIQQASIASETHSIPALNNLSTSQDGLERELQHLDEEVKRVTDILETVTLDPETSARLEETQNCLNRTKKKLLTIRARLGRLRTYEESDRLQLSLRELEVVQANRTETSVPEPVSVHEIDASKSAETGM